MAGRREVSIIFYRPVTRSDLKQERSFFRGSVSSFLQLVVAKNTDDKYRKNDKNNKCYKIQNLEREEAKKGHEMSANVAKLAKVTKFSC